MSNTTGTLIQSTKRVLNCSASAMFNAILDFTLDNPTPRTDPQVTALSITSDGFLMAWNTANPFKEGFVGTVGDFEQNVRGICKHVGLTPEATEEVLTHAYTKIPDWRSTGRRGANPYAQKG